MKCQKVKKQLVLFVGDDLPERKKKSVESHLKHCQTCATELKGLRDTKDLVHRISQIDLPDRLYPDFPNKVMQLIVDKQKKSPYERGKSLIWISQNPARIVGFFALATILIASAIIIFISSGEVTSDRLIEKILSISERESSELKWDPDHIFFKAFSGPYRLDSWEAPKQSGVYAVMHKSITEDKPDTYIIDFCGQGHNLSSYRGYPWIHHRIKRLVARTGATENVYIAVLLMPDSSKLERRQIEEALVKTFNPYFNRGA
jgi:hypothetical protein